MTFKKDFLDMVCLLVYREFILIQNKNYKPKENEVWGYGEEFIKYFGGFRNVSTKSN